MFKLTVIFLAYWNVELTKIIVFAKLQFKQLKTLYYILAYDVGRKKMFFQKLFCVFIDQKKY